MGEQAPELPLDPRVMLEREIKVVEQDYLAAYSNPEHSFSQLLDSRDPTLRPQMVTLYMQELEALRALDPDTVTLEEIAQTRQKYEDEIEQLYKQSAS